MSSLIREEDDGWNVDTIIPWITAGDRETFERFRIRVQINRDELMWPHSKNGQPTIRDNGYSPQKPNKSNTKDVKMLYLGILGLLSSFSLKKNGLYKYKNKN